MNESERGTEAGASRRSVLKAAAWATPVVVMMTAAPLAAATGVSVTLQPSDVEEWESGEGVLLIFAVTGAAEGTPVAAEITTGYPTVAGWLNPGPVAGSSVNAGYVVLLAEARTTGRFSVNLSFDGYSGNFEVDITVVP